MSTINSAYPASTRVTRLTRATVAGGLLSVLAITLACSSNPTSPSSSSNPTSPSTGTCAYRVAPTTQDVSNTGGIWNVNVSRISGSCSWSATADVSWISFTNVLTGSESDLGTLAYRVAALLDTSDRSGHITMSWSGGSGEITVNQHAYRVPTGAVSTLTITGMVTEEGRPIANAGVSVDPVVDPTGISVAIVGESGEPFGGTTDAGGHYRLTLYFYNRVPQQVTLWGLTFKDGYVQQCATKTTVVGETATLDLRLTSIGNLSTARPMSDPGSRTASGILFETTASGPHPVQGATVGWYDFFDESDGMAHTLTDANGFYLLCGLPQTRIVTSGDIYDGGFYAYKEGVGDASQIPVVEAGTSDVVLNIELKGAALRSPSLKRLLHRSVDRGYRKKR
jgi:hypothetical protein